jgi:tetratricopeptide (TPR) repeat protein
MSRVGPYELQDVLGRGGQGLVARARHLQSGAVVALKVLLDPFPDGATRGRFEQEASVLSRLAHPNLVRVVDRGDDQGRPWLAMALVEGPSLEALGRQGRLSVSDVAALVAPIARGVAYLHEVGVVHRDVKPANVIVETATGRPVLVDLGLAKRDAGRLTLSRDAGGPLTASGEVLGTPAFMAPEQADPGGDFGPVGPWSDVHALGATLYALVVGQPPFVGATVLDTLRQVLEREPQSPRRAVPDLPEALEALILRCLRKRAAERPSAASVADALDALLRDEVRARRAPRRRSRVRPVLALAGLAVALALVVGLVARGALPGEPPAPVVATPTPTPVTPWPAAPADRPRWRLADGGATHLTPALWEERDVAAPVARALSGEPAALREAFTGEARLAPAGRVAVRYGPGDLHPAWTLLGHAMLGATTRAPPVAPAPDHGPDAVSLRADDSTGSVGVTVGGARWRSAAVSFEARRRRTVDRDSFQVRLGQRTPGPVLSFTGLGRHVSAAIGSRAGGTATCALPLDGWLAVSLAPGAPAGARVLLDGAPVPALEATFEARPPDTIVILTFDEADLVLRGLEVEGEPLRLGSPALATAPAGGAPWRVALAFERLDATGHDGGPLVALLDAEGRAIALELDGPRLLLRRDDEALAVADVGDVRRGWLLLERDGGALRGLAGLGEAGAVTLEAADPFGGPGVRAAWGSSGPRVRALDVEVVAAGVDGPAASPALDAWRGAARDLARLACPRRADLSLAGKASEQRARRGALARASAEALELAAGSLSGVVRRDAQARAALGYALAGLTTDADRLTSQALAEGDARAREAFDALGPGFDAHRGLVDLLVKGWSPLESPDLRDAMLTIARRVVPERDAELSLHEGEVLYERGRDGEGRPAWERALARYRHARAAGGDLTLIAPREGGVLDLLERREEALVAWREATRLNPDYVWWWRELARDLAALGHLDEAVVAALGGAARGGGNPTHRALVLELSTRPGVAPGVMLAAAWAVSRGVDRAVEERVVVAARAARDAAAGRDADLMALVLGEAPPPGERPTATLARAARGEPDALAALSLAAAADDLVRHLALLDPALAPHAR